MTGLKNPIRHGPVHSGLWRLGVPVNVPARALKAAKLTPHRPTRNDKTPRQLRHLPRGPGLLRGLEGRCSIQLSYRRVPVFCEVSTREASFSGAGTGLRPVIIAGVGLVGRGSRSAPAPSSCTLAELINGFAPVLPISATAVLVCWVVSSVKQMASFIGGRPRRDWWPEQG